MKKRNKHKNIVLLARSELYSIENITFEALTQAEISHQEVVLISNETKTLQPKTKY